MYSHILVAVLLIPVGLGTMMRGSDGLNAGRFGAGEAGVMTVAGVGMVLSGLALLMGALVAGVLALLALAVGTAVWVRQRRRVLGGRLRPADLAGRAAFLAVVTLLIVAGWR